MMAGWLQTRKASTFVLVTLVYQSFGVADDNGEGATFPSYVMSFIAVFMFTGSLTILVVHPE